MKRDRKPPEQIICETLEAIDNRCMANDGPVPPTLACAEPEELRAIYQAADAIRKQEPLRRAIRLERGGVYVLQLSRSAPQSDVNQIREDLRPMSEELGIRFLVLGSNMNLLTQEVEEKPS